MLLNALSFGADADVYAAQPVTFDGTNDYLTRDADLTGVVDNGQATVSFWFKSSSATTQRPFTNTTNRFGVAITDRVNLYGRTSAGVGALDTTYVADLRDGAWHHYIYSFNLTDTNKRHLYVDNVLRSPSYTAYVASVLDYSRPDHSIGAEVNGASKVNGELADVWVNNGVSSYLDLSVLDNLRKFISGNGKPVYLGADGSLPTGTAPIMFFSGPTVAWHTNKGSGGGFTENGALTDGSGGVEL